MRRYWAAAILAAMAAATPAAAADLATLGCVRDKMTAPVRPEIVASAQALADGKTAAASQALRDGMLATAQACATQYQWSNAARDAAQTHALVSVSLDTVRPLAKDRKVNLDVFASAIAALTPTERTQILKQEQAGTDALLARLASKGLVVQGSGQGSLIGVLAVLTLFQESQQAAFIAS